MLFILTELVKRGYKEFVSAPAEVFSPIILDIQEFLNLLLLFLGMIMDAGPIILIVAPIIYPVAMSFGIDPVQLGCIIVFNLSVGQATPPFGLCLFAAQPVTKQSIGILSRAVFPFVIILYAMVLTTSFIPALSLAIPNLM